MTPNTVCTREFTYLRKPLWPSILSVSCFYLFTWVHALYVPRHLNIYVNFIDPLYSLYPAFTYLCPAFKYLHAQCKICTQAFTYLQELLWTSILSISAIYIFTWPHLLSVPGHLNMYVNSLEPLYHQYFAFTHLRINMTQCTDGTREFTYLHEPHWPSIPSVFGIFVFT